MEESFAVETLVIVTVSKLFHSGAAFFVIDETSLVNVALKSDVDSAAVHEVVFPFPKVYIAVRIVNDSRPVFKILLERAFVKVLLFKDFNALSVF